jgi:hypothetical protein
LGSCPLCGTAFGDREGYVAHLEVVHGLTDDAGTTSASPEPVPVVEPQSTPAPEPFTAPGAEPGSTVRVPDVYPLGSAVEPSAARGPNQRVAVVAGIVVLVVIVAAVVVFTGGGSNNTNTAAVVGTSATNAAATTSEPVNLLDDILQPADLPNWQVVTPPTTIQEGPPTPGCASPADAKPRTVYASEYSYASPGAGGGEQGHIVSEAFQMDTPATTDAMRAFETSPTYAQCFQDRMANQALAGIPSDFHPVITSMSTAPIQRLPAGVDNAVETVIHIGGTDVVPVIRTERVYHLFHGTYAVTFYIGSCGCEPFPLDAAAQRDTAILAGRLEALPG